ncbi:hypothetical protein K2X05_05100, partial [bacterium]|nr:hypothetical protein [bacterium]
EAVQVLPMVEGSWQNKMALELWQKHGAKVFVDLLGRKIAAGVFSGFDIHAFKYDRILVLSLAEFMFDGLQSRSEVFRHELRHLGFIKKIREGALTEKIPLTTGMILAQSEVAGFRREIWGLQEDGYRDFLSLEELWTYTHDARFDVEILLRKIKQQKDLNDIYERNERIENAVRRLIVFFARAAQIGDSMRLQDFYTLTTFIDSRTQRPSVSMMSGGQGSEVDLLSKWAPLLYGHDIVHGIYKVKSNHQDEGFFWLSMPLTVREDKQSGNYLFLKRQMNQRIASLASISQKSREDLLPSYNQWLKATQEFLYKPHSPEDAKNLARVYIQSLQGLYDSLLRTKLLIN